MAKKTHFWLRWLVIAAFGLVVALVFLFITTSLVIGDSIRETCLETTQQYSGDCVEALMETLQDESNSYRERNHAIWALGQLGDVRALSTVERYYTGNVPAKEPYDQGLSQYEMHKALKLLQGGTNFTHFVWQPEKVIDY